MLLEKGRNNSRNNKEMEPKWKQCPGGDGTGDGSKGQCCKEQYCIGTWNVRYMNQCKLEVVKQEMARMNIDILGISELKRNVTSKFNSDDNYLYCCWQESLRKKWSNSYSQWKSLKCSTQVQSKKWQKDHCSFPRQTFNITVIQDYVPTTNDEVEVEWFYEDLKTF